VTLLVAAVWGYRIGIASAILANLLLNFFFVPPRYTLNVAEPSNVVALLIYLAVALVGASMLSLLRRQVAITAARGTETAILLDLSQELAAANSPQNAMNKVCVIATKAFHAAGASIVRQSAGWSVVGAVGEFAVLPREEEAIAAEAVRTGQVARLLSDQYQHVKRLGREAAYGVTFVPFGSLPSERGVLRISGSLSPPPYVDGERLLRAFADQACMALDRFRLTQEAMGAEALRRADEFKTILLSTVTHDLRSPLTAIKAAVESLRQESIAWTDDDRDTFHATIEAQTDRLSATVTNLLEMSRLEGGAVRPTIEAIETLPLLADVVHLSSTATSGREVRVESVPGIWVRADYGLLVQALRNLVENAARYSWPGRPITLSAAPARPGRVTLEVADEGPGISETDLPHIFDKFYRGAQANNSSGQGLGLAMVKAMVELCHGEITVQSGPGRTLFSLELSSAVEPHR
jgi:two-component system sensor histidine kinase KdpD